MSKIKNFYDQLNFPGPYTAKQLQAYGTHPDNRYLKFIDKYLTHGQTVLDAGCGTGLITNVFATRLHSEFDAVDFANSINYGKHYAATNGLNNVRWYQQDLTQFKTTKKYDVVICQGVLHHIPDYGSTLHNLKSCIKPGGILLLGLYNPYGKILKKFINIDYKSSMLEQDQEHNPFELSFTVKQVKSLCQDLEFLGCTPSLAGKYWADFLSLFNSRNGGLVLYAFKEKTS